jgi:glutamate-1-semialdehyde 2,1-aminomutase
MATILETFQKRHPRSAELYAQSLQTFPSGVTHDVRYLTPFPIFIDHALGSHKWDVDGHEAIDYILGHGVLFLGHGHPAIVEALSQQLGKGTHYGANHELELRWGQLVQRLVPSAQLVRFTSTGTEATMLAIRLARAFTGRDRILKFDYHFHGWHDAVLGARFAGSQSTRPPGVPAAILANTMSIPQNDIDLVEKTLSANQVAAVILEPTGPSWGVAPLADGFLADLREVTQRHQVLLIFDEVVTGFRVSRGGAQERYGVLPDLTCLAKILGGGLPCGAAVGQADILNLIQFRDDADWEARRVPHYGTYNANPLSAAAGSTILSIIADDDLHPQVGVLNEKLIQGMNHVLERRRAVGAAYGLSSYFHITLVQACPRPQGSIEWSWVDGQAPPPMPQARATALRWGMLNHGVDLMRGRTGFISAAHTEGDIQHTLDAFDAVIGEMQKEGLL